MSFRCIAGKEPDIFKTHPVCPVAQARFCYLQGNFAIRFLSNQLLQDLFRMSDQPPMKPQSAGQQQQ